VTSSPTIGIVGLGLLGHAVASRLRAAGHAVVGYDVAPERVEALQALGGRGLGSVSAVADAADPLLVLLPSLATVEDVILGPRGLLTAGRTGQTVIQMSTISPALTERLARETEARGRGFLDCPVSGTSLQVARGQGMLIVGGAEALAERWRPVLESILKPVAYAGRAGQAMFVKLLANMLVALHSAAAAEALAMARRAGLDPARVLEILTSGAGSSGMLALRGPLMVRGEFPPQMKLELFMKDLHLIQEAAASVGAQIPLTEVAERLYGAAQAAGHGGEDLSVVVTTLQADAQRRRG
jgi:3-hydroxyisobutyrate dehydrogenase-like beta-hydroxyacid dehydrogenase